MKTKKLPEEFNLALIWFGAGVSVAEIITGTYFAPLGFFKGLAAVLTGHVIGAVLFFMASYIGAVSKKSAMETVKISFGNSGAKFFALLNVMQLLGWTGIMVYDGGNFASGIFGNSARIWMTVIGVLIAAWIFLGVANVSRLNAFSLSLLFVLTLILSKKIFCSVAQNEADFSAEKISFGAAVELAVAMPLSWIPLAADYTKNSGKKLRGSLVSTLSYFFTSCWMYTIGMGAAIFTRETDVPKIMANSLGAASLIVVVLSTVTTAFLDAYSAGVSFETIVPRAKGKFVSVAAAAAGTFFALIFNLDNITDFLYLIGGVFLPMISIMAADFFVLKKNHSEEKFYAANFVLWIFGFALYRISLSWNFPLGNSVAVAAIVFFASILTEKILQKFRGKKSL